MSPNDLPVLVDARAEQPARRPGPPDPAPAAGRRARFGFLCHGSTSVGLGHVMRCRSVAEAALREADLDLEARLFVVGDDTVEPLLAARPAGHEIHPSDEAAASAIERYAPDALFFDLLRVDDAVFTRLAGGRTTVALSPIFNRLDDVDLFFHRTAVHPRDAARRGPGWRCGLEYAIVRPECAPIPTAHYLETLDAAQPLNIAISMGGGDAGNKTLGVLRALRALARPMVLWVLLGEGYAHSYRDLVECVRRDTAHEIILAKSSDSMWRIVRHCAVAVLAAGTTTYEAAAAGLPTINTFDDPAHRFLVAELVDRGAAFDAGAPFDAALAEVRRLLCELDRDRGRLLAAHEAARRLIDGHGARRVVTETLGHVARTPRALGASRGAADP